MIGRYKTEYEIELLNHQSKTRIIRTIEFMIFVGIMALVIGTFISYSIRVEAEKKSLQDSVNKYELNPICVEAVKNDNLGN